MARARPDVTPVRIRSFRAGDLGGVRRVWVRAGLRLGPSDSRSRIERMRARDPDLFLVAESARRIVGAVLGRYDGHRGWVHHLAVDPSVQRRGVGRRLMAEVEARLRSKGCIKVNLHVEPSNRQVVRFYSEIGFQRREMLFLEKWLIRRGPTARPSGSAVRVRSVRGSHPKRGSTAAPVG